MRSRHALALLLLVPACTKSGAGAAKEDMQLVPREADIVVTANLGRMRPTAMWRKVLDLRDSNPSNKKDFDEFVKKCELDPFTQIDSVFLALPGAGSASKEFAAVLRGTFKEDKLIQCAKDQAKKDGGDLAITEYNGKKLYSDAKQQQAFAAFLDGKTVVVGGKEWIKKVVDLAKKKEPGGSAKDNEPLMSLVKRAKTGDALWGAGLVPDPVREQLKNDPMLAAASSMKNVFGSVDFGKGLSADVNLDTGSENDAKELAAKATGQLMESKKNPQLMMMGMSTYLEAVKIEAKGATFHVGLNLTQQQVDDLIARLSGLLKSFGGALGGQPAQPGLTP